MTDSGKLMLPYLTAESCPMVGKEDCRDIVALIIDNGQATDDSNRT
jgi:hypothetical protein